MKFSKIALFTMAAGSAFVAEIVQAQGQMVKMCLFYGNPSGHARSDPIINQQCASGHVHTFYGPLGFHPDTTYEDLINTPPELSTSPVEENQSLYWHPSIYEVTDNGDGTETFTRVSNLDSGPYYRWDNSVEPKTEAFPPAFRMIAGSDDNGANVGDNMFTECCDLNSDGEEESCQEWDRLFFPERSCGFLGIAFAMPTCWDGVELGNNNNHKDHMRYTEDGQVDGECPPGFNHRVPQIQLFVRIPGYKGGKYQLSDGRSEFHVDFFNGWQEGKLQEIIDGCPFSEGQEIGEYNPPCNCAPHEESTINFLTENENVPKAVCDDDVRRLIIDEVTDVTTTLPMDACQGPPLIEKSWDQLSADLFTCDLSNPALDDDFDDDFDDDGAEESSMRWVVCGRGVGEGLRACPEGEMLEEDAESFHEVRCCRDGPGNGWRRRCRDRDAHGYVFGKSQFDGHCHVLDFYDAIDLCEEFDGRLCTKDEILSSCTKGTGCGHDRELIWTCTEEFDDCVQNSECCSGMCDEDGVCEPW